MLIKVGSIVESDVAENDHLVPSVLYVVSDRWAEDAVYVVTADTVARAAEVAAQPGLPETFGELRRAGDIDELEKRISRFADVGEYVAAIERSAGRQRSSDQLEARLAALVDVEFEGADSDSGEYLPSDEDRTANDEEWALDQPASRFWSVLQWATRSDVPDDLFRQFCEERDQGRPGGDFLGYGVRDGLLDAWVAALEQRGHRVVRDAAALLARFQSPAYDEY